MNITCALSRAHWTILRRTSDLNLVLRWDCELYKPPRLVGSHLLLPSQCHADHSSSAGVPRDRINRRICPRSFGGGHARYQDYGDQHRRLRKPKRQQ